MAANLFKYLIFFFSERYYDRTVIYMYIKYIPVIISTRFYGLIRKDISFQETFGLATVQGRTLKPTVAW